MKILSASPIFSTSTIIKNKTFLQNSKVSFSSAPDTFEKETADTFYESVLADKRQEKNYGSTKASSQETAQVIKSMEKAFVLEDGTPNRKFIAKLIDKCRDDHYGGFVSKSSTAMLYKVTALKDTHGANDKAVEEILNLFCYKDPENKINVLLDNNNYKEGYDFLFKEMPNYIDKNGNFDKYLWIQKHFSKTAQSYSDFGKGPCYCFD